MKTKSILEARKNPSSNKLITFEEFITNVRNSGVPSDRLFFSFQNLTKLGVNPKSTWDTPSGIYAYPGGYFLKRCEATVGKFNRFNQKPNPLEIPRNLVPYGTASKFLFAFEFTGNLLDVSDFETVSRLESYILPEIGGSKALFDKLNIIPQFRYGRFENLDELRESIDTASYIETLIRVVYYLVGAAKITPDGIIFDASSDEGTVNSKPAKVAKWFMKYGIDGLIDHGTGTIYNTEPHQVVFFNVKGIKIINTFVASSARKNGQGYNSINAKRHFDSFNDSPDDLIRDGNSNELKLYILNQIRRFDRFTFGRTDVDFRRILRNFRHIIKTLQNNVIIKCKKNNIDLGKIGEQVENLYNDIDDLVSATNDLYHFALSTEGLQLKMQISKTQDFGDAKDLVENFIAKHLKNYDVLKKWNKTLTIDEIVHCFQGKNEDLKRRLNSMFLHKLEDTAKQVFQIS